MKDRISKKCVVVQPRVLHYRIPFFNRVSAKLDLDFQVAYSGSALRKDAQFATIQLPMYEIQTYGIGPLRYQRNVLKAIRGSDVAVLPLNPRTVSNLWPLFRKCSSRLIYWGHGLGRRDWVNYIRLWMSSQVDATILYAETERDAFTSRGVAASQLFVAPNSQYVSNSGFNGNIDRRTFLFVGRLRRGKKIDHIIRAFAKLKKEKRHQIQLEIVGDGPVRASLEHLTRALKVEESVSFLGKIIDDDALKPIFQRALAYISPGHVGLGVLHSFAYGIPVVTYEDQHHAPEVHNIEESGGGWFCNATPGDLARTISEIANAPYLSYEKGKKGFDHYRSCRTIDHAVDGFCRGINYVMNKS
jgi:glycosyltransferase involved in cell wall biosynthesis